VGAILDPLQQISRLQDELTVKKSRSEKLSEEEAYGRMRIRR
jgi:hypothetical protein